jgi:hypothetical protein
MFENDKNLQESGDLMKKKTKYSAENELIMGSDGTGKTPSLDISYKIKSIRKPNTDAVNQDYELELSTSTTIQFPGQTIDN